MEPEKESHAASRRGWWWMVLVALPVLYVLGMAPLSVLAERWRAPTGVLGAVSKVEGPLYAGAAHWKRSQDWLNDYQRWWIRKLNGPEDIREFIYPADFDPPSIPPGTTITPRNRPSR